MKRSAILLVLTTISLGAFAHTVNYNLEGAPVTDVFLYYMKLGVRHIIPEGFDHILFVIGLCLLSTNIRVLLSQLTAFTVAHTISLILCMKGWIVAPPAVVEPLIALSIAFVAIENIVIQKLKPWRILVIFGFGLVHGMGFAGSLNELGLPRDAFYQSLLSFNVGVEIGQAIVVCAFYFLCTRWIGKANWYRKGFVFPASGAIAALALYWTVIRLIG